MASSLDARKALLRQRIAPLRARQPLAARKIAAAAVMSRLFASREYDVSSLVAAYIAVGGELDVERLIRRCHDEGRRVVVPARLDDGQDGYGLRELLPGAELIRGPFAVPEPRDGEWIEPGMVDLWVCPGVAFDRWGGRTGYGGGFYDRLLSVPRSSGRGRRIGVCFAFQLVSRVPCEGHDIPMHSVICDKGVWRAPRVRQTSISNVSLNL
jgi:5-formyltetrahydrofolate cyclo-ligase